MVAQAFVRQFAAGQKKHARELATEIRRSWLTRPNRLIDLRG
jgi:hypothetical protein